jgi:Alkylmercury lyase
VITDTDLRVRRAILESFASGGIPTRPGVMHALGLHEDLVAASYAVLADAHVIVRHPATGEVWMAMPFSAVPTDFPVIVGGRSVWANCAWDAFGIAAALGADVSFITPCPQSGASLAAGVRSGVAFAPHTAVAHIAVPAARWWVDIGDT